MLPNQPALLDETDRKLYTLLALRELGGCTHTQLLYFMFENDIMSYFDLALALHELVDEGQLGAPIIRWTTCTPPQAQGLKRYPSLSTACRTAR